MPHLTLLAVLVCVLVTTCVCLFVCALYGCSCVLGSDGV